jgi:hypothetical protein
MSDFNTSKVDGNTVGSAEWNQLSDVDNLTTTSGQTPSTTDLFQLSIASARYSSGGQFFTDSGTANTYVLSPVSPFKSPVDATNTYFNGMTIRFRAGNANSGASTINVNGAGLKNLKKEDGSTDLTSGDILPTKDSTFRYNGTSFVIVQDIRPATTTNQGVVYLNNPITIANNATDANNDIDFSAGNAPLDDGSGQVLLSSTLVKRLDASWVAGTNQNGLFSGTKANSTKYYLFAITNGTIIDAGFDISPTGANIPAGYKGSYRGMIKTDASGNILAFKQNKNKTLLTSPITEYSGTVGATYANLTSSNVPLKDNIEAILNLNFNVPVGETNGRSIKFKDLISLQEKQAITSRPSAIIFYITQPDVIIALNSSGQFQYKSVDAITPSTDTSTTGILEIKLNGWIDNNIKL